MRDVLTATEPVRAFIAVLAGSRVICAGPIIGRTWDEDNAKLTLRGTGESWLMTRRRAIPASIPGRVQDATLGYTGLSYGTIQKRLVQESLARPNGSLPIVLPADEAGTVERHYEGFELAEVWQRVSELSAVFGGPEVAFEPRLTTDLMGVEHVMRTGTTADPVLHQTGQDWIVDLGAPHGNVGGLKVVEDGSAVTNLAWATGDGMDTALMLSASPDASAPSAGYPLLESVRSYSSVKVQGTLDGHAQSDVAGNARPWRTWSLRVQADERLGQYRNGDWWTVRVPRGHLFLEPGSYRSRMASHKGSIGSQWVDIELVPMEVTS
jgi:hypothetical protein